MIKDWNAERRARYVVSRKIVACANRGKLEEPFARRLEANGLAPFEREYRFAAAHVGWNDEEKSLSRQGKAQPLRLRLKTLGLSDWRFDFAWPTAKVAVEIDGAGRHQTHKGFAEDHRKINAAVLLGWRVLRYTGRQSVKPQAIREAMKLVGTRPSGLKEGIGQVFSLDDF